MRNENKFYILEIFGSNLKKIRENKNMSLKELSIKTQMRVEYLKKIENGTAYGLTISKIFIIANALNTTPSFFVEGI